jgi:hypothetical protein
MMAWGLEHGAWRENLFHAELARKNAEFAKKTFAGLAIKPLRSWRENFFH